MIVDRHSRTGYSWRWLKPAALLLVVIVGLAMTAAARYRPQAFQRLWKPGHSVLLRVMIDPVRHRTHGALSQLRRARDLWHADEQNEMLRRELAALAATNQMLREDMERVRRLTGMESWGGPPDMVFLAADVVGVDTYEGALLIINRGEMDGIAPGDPAVALGGLVGKVRTVSARSATIQTLIDPQSVVGAVGVGRSGERSRGVVHGRGFDGKGQSRPLEFFPENEVQPIEPGAVLISTGFRNSIYPKGLVIGAIEGKSLDPYGLPYGVVRPAMPIGEVEEVLVLLPAERARGKGIKPAFTEEGLSSLTMTMAALADATTETTQAVETMPTTGTQPVQLRMPRPGIELWAGSSTEALALMLGDGATTETFLQYWRGPLDDLRATTATLPTTYSAIAVPTPEPGGEAPMPARESFNERRDLKSEWPSQWTRGGGE